MQLSKPGGQRLAKKSPLSVRTPQPRSVAGQCYAAVATAATTAKAAKSEQHAQLQAIKAPAAECADEFELFDKRAKAFFAGEHVESAREGAENCKAEVEQLHVMLGLSFRKPASAEEAERVAKLLRALWQVIQSASENKVYIITASDASGAFPSTLQRGHFSRVRGMIAFLRKLQHRPVTLDDAIYLTKQEPIIQDALMQLSGGVLSNELRAAEEVRRYANEILLQADEARQSYREASNILTGSLVTVQEALLDHAVDDEGYTLERAKSCLADFNEINDMVINAAEAPLEEAPPRPLPKAMAVHADYLMDATAFKEAKVAADGRKAGGAFPDVNGAAQALSEFSLNRSDFMGLAHPGGAPAPAAELPAPAAPGELPFAAVAAAAAPNPPPPPPPPRLPTPAASPVKAYISRAEAKLADLAARGTPTKGTPTKNVPGAAAAAAAATANPAANGGAANPAPDSDTGGDQATA